MKLLSLLATFVFFSLTLCAQSDVPEVVKEAFNKQFAGAKSVNWEYESVDIEYEAAFKWERKRMTAKFDPEGNWLETEFEINQSQLPAAVKMALKMEYADYDIDSVEKISTPERKEAYEITLEKDNVVWKLSYTASGKLLGKEVEEEE